MSLSHHPAELNPTTTTMWFQSKSPTVTVAHTHLLTDYSPFCLFHFITLGSQLYLEHTKAPYLRVFVFATSSPGKALPPDIYMTDFVSSWALSKIPLVPLSVRPFLTNLCKIESPSPSPPPLIGTPYFHTLLNCLPCTIRILMYLFVYY